MRLWATIRILLLLAAVAFGIDGVFHPDSWTIVRPRLYERMVSALWTHSREGIDYDLSLICLVLSTLLPKPELWSSNEPSD